MKKINVIIVIILLACVNQKGFTQVNLIPNPSFEYFSICPIGLDFIYEATPWFQPYAGNMNVTIESSSDYYNACDTDTTQASVPHNVYGFQYARTGVAYAGFASFYLNNYREYIEVQLDSPLIAGNGYCLQYYVSLAENSAYVSNNIDAYFSNDSLIDYRTNFGHSFISVQPQITETAIITDTSEEWVIISGFYIAHGGEQFITFGNFYDDANTLVDTLPFNNNAQHAAYYYIDDVSLKWCSGVGMNEAKGVKDYVNVYPSLNDGRFTLSYHLNNKSEFLINDIAGRNVYHQTINNNDGRVSIDADLIEGIYYWEMIKIPIESGEIYSKGKIVIIK